MVLIQNAFSTLEKYIDHIHLNKNGEPAKIVDSVKEEILSTFKHILRLKEQGVNLFFADIDKIKEILEKELVTNK